MGLFSKKPAPVAEISYDDVVTYLRDLEQVDYTKILKVVETYREADKKVKKILGIKENRVTDPNTADELAAVFLDDDDTSIGNFLDDEPVKTTTVKVTNAPKAKGKKK